MIELLIFAIGYAVLAMVVCIRLVKGPSGIDRAVASDCVDTLTTVSLALFAVFSGRSIYLDISMTLASFIKVTQSVFFGELPVECENVKIGRAHV